MTFNLDIPTVISLTVIYALSKFYFGLETPADAEIDLEVPFYNSHKRYAKDFEAKSCLKRKNSGSRNLKVSFDNGYLMHPLQYKVEEKRDSAVDIPELSPTENDSLESPEKLESLLEMDLLDRSSKNPNVSESNQNDDVTQKQDQSATNQNTTITTITQNQQENSVFFTTVPFKTVPTITKQPITSESWKTRCAALFLEKTGCRLSFHRTKAPKAPKASKAARFSKFHKDAPVNADNLLQHLPHVVVFPLMACEVSFAASTSLAAMGIRSMLPSKVKAFIDARA